MSVPRATRKFLVAFRKAAAILDADEEKNGAQSQPERHGRHLFRDAGAGIQLARKRRRP
jgi:hypothetical protein